MWGMITKCIESLFYGMLPPPMPTKMEDKVYMEQYQEKVAKWRRAMVNIHWLEILTISVLIVFVFGVLLPDAWNRVAWAQDVGKEVKQQIKPLEERVTEIEKSIPVVKGQLERVEKVASNTLALQLRNELRETRRLQCLAIINNDGERRRHYGNMLDDLKDQYETLRGKPWVRPGCDEV